MQDLWQSRYQILLIVLLKVFIKLNVNMAGNDKCKNCRIKYKYCVGFLEYTNIKDNRINRIEMFMLS